MTQFKDKSESQQFVSAALFTYPVLQAGDILLYQTTSSWSASTSGSTSSSPATSPSASTRASQTFTLPRGVYPEIGAKLMDLQEPEKKMSTTGHRAGHRVRSSTRPTSSGASSRRR